MKKNKITLSIFVAVCIIGTIVGYNLIKHNESNKYNQLAVMTQQDDGTYITSNMSVFGNDEYEFDHAVCNNGTTVTANSSGGVNLKLLGTDKCTVYLKKKKIFLDLIIESALPSTNAMYQEVEPSNEISSVSDDNFSKEEQTYTVDTTHQNYYMTYADSYTFNTPTMSSSASNSPSYTLTSPQVGKYSDIYGSLVGKYVVNYEGHSQSTAAYSTRIDRIYKVVSATSNSITYIPSSYTMEFTDNGTTGVYIAEDYNGTSYYFRGNVTNNYVKYGKWTEEVYRGYNSAQSGYKDYFTQAECLADGTYNYGCNKSPVAGKDMYWRIVRSYVNTLILIYDGTEAYANGTRNLDRFALQWRQFNNLSNNNAYVGFMYGDINGTSYEEVHANTNDSLIKIALDTWYEKNFAGTEYEYEIFDAFFCNDRSLYSGTGIGTTETYYGAYGRLDAFSTSNPSLECPQLNDLFTRSYGVGNAALKYHVRLLTADEVVLAGGLSGFPNRGYYINKGYPMHLGTPYKTNNIFYVTTGGVMQNVPVTAIAGVTPVISLNIRGDLKGSGTMENPYHY